MGIVRLHSTENRECGLKRGQGHPDLFSVHLPLMFVMSYTYFNYLVKDLHIHVCQEKCDNLCSAGNLKGFPGMASRKNIQDMREICHRQGDALMLKLLFTFNFMFSFISYSSGDARKFNLFFFVWLLKHSLFGIFVYIYRFPFLISAVSQNSVSSSTCIHGLEMQMHRNVDKLKHI